MIKIIHSTFMKPEVSWRRKESVITVNRIPPDNEGKEDQHRPENLERVTCCNNHRDRPYRLGASWRVFSYREGDAWPVVS